MEEGEEAEAGQGVRVGSGQVARSRCKAGQTGAAVRTMQAVGNSAEARVTTAECAAGEAVRQVRFERQCPARHVQ